MFADADMAAKLARMRSLRDLDASALKLRAAGLMLLDPEIADANVRRAIFSQIERDAFLEAVDLVGSLAEPHQDTYFASLREHPRKLGYLPNLL